MGRVVYMDGKFIPEAEAKVSIYSLDVMQSAAAFEMTRSFHGVHFKLMEHIDRLKHSCELLGIPLPYQDWVRRCYEVSDLNDHGPGEEHRLLIVVSPGCAKMYSELEGVIPHPFLYIADFPLRFTVQGFSKYFLEGVHCTTSKIQQVPDACIPSQAKHRSRLHFHLAQQQADAGTWPILCAEESGPFGEGVETIVTEAPGANLVYVDHENKVYTCEHNALQGISMQTVKDLTGATAELCGTDPKTLTHPKWIKELWLTGTPFCMLPVVSLDGKPIGDGTIGPVYRETLYKWNQLVGLDIAKQIRSWDAAMVTYGDETPGLIISEPPSQLWTPDVERARPIKH